MALINDAANSWSLPVTLPSDEIWQVRAGCVYLTTTASPDPEDGFALLENHAVALSAGSEVRYRKEGLTATVIVREAV